MHPVMSVFYHIRVNEVQMQRVWHLQTCGLRASRRSLFHINDARQLTAGCSKPRILDERLTSIETGKDRRDEYCDRS